jgi:hypothetical protein
MRDSRVDVMQSRYSMRPLAFIPCLCSHSTHRSSPQCTFCLPSLGCVLSDATKMAECRLTQSHVMVMGLCTRRWILLITFRMPSYCMLQYALPLLTASQILPQMYYIDASCSVIKSKHDDNKRHTRNICKDVPWAWTYTAFGKYSDPLTFSTFCYITTLF